MPLDLPELPGLSPWHGLAAGFLLWSIKKLSERALHTYDKARKAVEDANEERRRTIEKKLEALIEWRERVDQAIGPYLNPPPVSHPFPSHPQTPPPSVASKPPSTASGE